MEDDKTQLRKSLFPEVPPYIRFLSLENEYSNNDEVSLSLCWKASVGAAEVVKECVEHTGAVLLEVKLYVERS